MFSLTCDSEAAQHVQPVNNRVSSNMEESLNATYKEDQPIRQRNWKETVWFFTLKYKWFIIAAVAIVIIMVLMSFITVPAIITAVLKNASLTFENLDLYNTWEDKFSLRFKVNLRVPTSLHPKLDSFDTEIFLPTPESEIVPFARFTMPELIIQKRNLITLDDPQLVPLDWGETRRFMRLLFTNNSTFPIYVRGKATVTLKPFHPVQRALTKRVLVKGVGAIEGYLPDYPVKLLFMPDEKGYNFYAGIRMPNKSACRLGLGDVHVNITHQGDPLGWGVLPNMTLLTTPFDSIVQLQAHVDIAKIVELTFTKYPDNVLPVNIHVHSVHTLDGAPNTYIQYAINSTLLNTTISIVQVLGSVGVDILRAAGLRLSLFGNITSLLN